MGIEHTAIIASRTTGHETWDVALVGESGVVEHVLGTVGARLREPDADLERPLGPALPDVVVVVAQQVDDALASRVAAIRSRAGAVPIVLVAERSAIGHLRGLLAAGVQGVVLRGLIGSTLLPTCAAVIAGQVCVPGEGARALERPDLSVREKQVVGLLAMGLRNREIGERLYIAESTVKSHLASAFAKLGVRTRRQAAELILNPSSGMGHGILYLDAEPVVASASRDSDR